MLAAMRQPEQIAALIGVIVGLILSLVFGYVFFRWLARRAPRPEYLGERNGRLADLPATPNAVSTQTDDGKRWMEPWPFVGDLDATRAALLDLLAHTDRVTIVTADEAYIHAEFRTKLIGFVDDVEFYLDARARVVHFRSASRLGRSDLGANRARMTRLEERWLARSVTTARPG